MTAPWLSVLMPTYNGAAYLRSALDSVVAQHDPEIECIAVDDGSTDDTVAILRTYADRMALEIVERPRVGDWVANTNIALARARGAFACLLHQDDTWLDGRLRRMKAATDRHPDVDLLLHPAWFIDSRGRRLGPWRCPLPAEPAVIDPAVILPRLMIQNFVAIPSPIFRTTAARAVGGLDDALWYTADWDFWLKLGATSRTLYLPEPLACFRVRPEAQTSRRSVDIADFTAQQDIVLDRHLGRLGADARRRTRRVAAFSIAVNTVLASRYHRQTASMMPVFTTFLRLAPWEWHTYLRHSRIWERVRARLRAQLRPGDARAGV